MMIIWAEKPHNYDTRATRVWFEKTRVLYTVEGTNHVLMAKLKDVQMILDDEAYRITGRGR